MVFGYIVKFCPRRYCSTTPRFRTTTDFGRYHKPVAHGHSIISENIASSRRLERLRDCAASVASLYLAQHTVPVSRTVQVFLELFGAEV